MKSLNISTRGDMTISFSNLVVEDSKVFDFEIEMNGNFFSTYTLGGVLKLVREMKDTVEKEDLKGEIWTFNLYHENIGMKNESHAFQGKIQVFYSPKKFKEAIDEVNFLSKIDFFALELFVKLVTSEKVFNTFLENVVAYAIFDKSVPIFSSKDIDLEIARVTRG